MLYVFKLTMTLNDILCNIYLYLSSESQWQHLSVTLMVFRHCICYRCYIYTRSTPLLFSYNIRDLLHPPLGFTHALSLQFCRLIQLDVFRVLFDGKGVDVAEVTRNTTLLNSALTILLIDGMPTLTKTEMGVP